MSFPVANPAYKLLGKGAVYAHPLDSTGTDLGGIFLGSCEDFSYSITSTTEKSMSSVEPVSTPDLVVLTGVECNLKCTLQEFSPQNVALFSRGSTSVLAQSSGGPLTDSTLFIGSTSVTATNKGRWFQFTYRNLTTAGITLKIGSTSAVLHTDYELDSVGGRVFVTSTTALTGALKLSGSYGADTSTTVDANLQSGRHAIKFVGNPFAGPIWEYLFYDCVLAGDGDHSLIGSKVGSFAMKAEAFAVSSWQGTTLTNGTSFFNAILRGAA